MQGLPLSGTASNLVLGLVWSRNDTVRDAAVSSFHRTHLEGRDAGDAVNGLLDMYSLKQIVPLKV